MNTALWLMLFRGGAVVAIIPQATRRTGILIGSEQHLHIEGSNRREQLDGTARRGELKQ